MEPQPFTLKLAQTSTFVVFPLFFLSHCPYSLLWFLGIILQINGVHAQLLNHL